MSPLLPITLASLLMLAPAVATAQTAVPDNPATDAPSAAPPQRLFDADVISYLVSRNKAKGLLEKCWHPAADYNGTLRYRVILDDDGKVTAIMPFSANKGDGSDEAARAAIQSCAPYTIEATGRCWRIADVRFKGQDVLVIALPHIPSERRKAPITPTDPLSLTQEETRGLRTQLTRCVPPPPSGANGRLQIESDLILNFDGSVSPDSKIVSSPTPELGQRVVTALVECQPYLLPAEKYAGWKLIPLSVDLVGQF
jgi:hypothetical protein